MKGSNSRWTTVAPNELSEKHSITGISRIPEAEVGFDGRKARDILVPLPIGTSFFGPSIAFTAKFPTCLITSQISLRRYHFLDIFFSSFPVLSRPPFPSFPFFSTLVSFAIGEDSECQQCSTKVDARCVCYWIPSRIPFSRRAAVSRNKLIEILPPL